MPKRGENVRKRKDGMDSAKLCVLLCLNIGLRIGEICGLKWSDIDFKQRVISIQRTVLKSLSEILGHTSVNITLNTYVHSSLEQKRNQIELLGIIRGQ